MLLIKKSLALTLIAVVVSFISFLQITRHSNLNVPEVLITLILGMGISALAFNLMHYLKIKSIKKTHSTTRVSISSKPLGKTTVIMNTEVTELPAVPRFSS